MQSSASVTLMQLTNDELDACLDVVKSYWLQIKDYTARPKLTNDDTETLFHYFEQLVEIVALDLANDQGRARLLQCLEKEEIFNEYFSWLLKLTDSTGRLKEHLLQSILPLCRPTALLSVVLPDAHLCQFLVSVVDYAISFNKQLLQQSRSALGPLDQINNLLGQIVLAIAKAIAANQDLFLAVYSNRCALLPAYRDYLTQASKLNDEEPRFPVISAMLSVALIAGESGDLAREAIVLLVDAVRQHSRTDIAIFLAENTDLCPVLATGLSGLFSTLPRVLSPDSNSVLFSSEKFDIFFDKPEPILFVECFRFVNRVVTLAHPAIRDRLVDFLYHGFLVPVLAPALNQPVGDELIATIVYLDYLCLQNLSDPNMAGAFVKFLLSANYDGMATIDTLIKYLDIPSKTYPSPSRASSSSSSSSVSSYWRLLFCTLGMFRSFLSLRTLAGSEDVFYELIHRHLSPLTHLMRSQRLQLVASTKARLRSKCVLCSLSNHSPSGVAGDHSYQASDALPNAFYKRGADHFLSLVTLDATPRDSDDSPTLSPSPPTPTKKHLFSAAIIRSLEDTPVGRQLLSEYTALLEECPRRLTSIDKQTKEWRKCGTLNSLNVGLCPTHRQLVMEQRDDEKFFDHDIWSEFDSKDEDVDSAVVSLDDAELELDEIVKALEQLDGNSDGESTVVEDALEKLDMADLSGFIPTAQNELPFAMNVGGIGQQRPHAESISATSSAKISVGPFLTRIFELVDHFTELPTPVIVALGTLLSHLASIPHPLLAPLLLDPQLNVHPNVKSLPLVLANVRERFVEKIHSEGYTSGDLRETLYAQCQQLVQGDFHFAEQMRHWSPSTSPLPADENHFSSPSAGSRQNAIKAAAALEPPNSPRSFFSRLLLSSSNRNAPVPSSSSPSGSVTARRTASPQRQRSLVTETTPVKRQSSIASSNEVVAAPVGAAISTSSSSEFEMTARGVSAKGFGSASSSERLALFSRSLVLFDATLLELSAISSCASRRFL